MKRTELLDGIKVLDLSHRLPGPYCAYILAGLGASVTKIEDQKFGDPFNDGMFAKMEESFKSWYHRLNDRKKIVKLDFNSSDDSAKIMEEIKKSQIIVLGPPQKIREKLKLTQNDLEKIKNSGEKVFLELLASSKETQSMHDINALAEIGMLGLHARAQKNALWIDPPFLPVAGLGFGNHISTTALAGLIKAKKENNMQFINCYLMDSAEELFSPFWSEELKDKKVNKFLHNGRYPCYSIYPTKDDQFVALAAVEEKFWVRFCQKFNLNLTPEERFFYQDDRVFKLLAKTFCEKNSTEIKEIRGEEDLCLSLFN